MATKYNTVTLPTGGSLGRAGASAFQLSRSGPYKQRYMCAHCGGAFSATSTVMACRGCDCAVHWGCLGQRSKHCQVWGNIDAPYLVWD